MPAASNALQASHAGPYTTRHVREMLGLSRDALQGLVASGFVTPQRGPRNEHRFSFQDMVLLRTAHALQAARIPPRRIVRALAELRRQLPAALPLTGLRITAVGDRVTVRDGAVQWEAESGQHVLDFELVPGSRSDVRVLPPVQPGDAFAWLARGTSLEPLDRAAAEQAYRQALRIDPLLPEPYLNLGALLCEDGRCDEAVALYDAAVQRGLTEDPQLHFNHAIALEDQGRLEEALRAYERVLRLAPDLADAHYNAALLHEKLGEPHLAIRRLSAYRRLQRP